MVAHVFIPLASIALNVATARFEEQKPTSATQEWEAEIVVGAAGAALSGRDSVSVQAAVDFAAKRGFKTVRLSAGSYTFRSAVQIPTGVRLAGMGNATVIRPSEAVRSKIVADSEWYQKSIELDDASKYSTGDSVEIACTNPDFGWAIDRLVVAKRGNRLLLSEPLGQNVFVHNKPECSNLHSLFIVSQSSDVEIRDLRIDGMVGFTETMNGNFGGAIFVTRSSGVKIAGVTVEGFNGDAISVQASCDVDLNHCNATGNRGTALHLGSGSQRVTCSNSEFSRNMIGVFLCWGVKQTSLRELAVSSSTEAGISVGHRCESFQVESCQISENGYAGLIVRSDLIGSGEDCPSGILLLHNTFSENGTADNQSPELQFDCAVREIQILGNTFSNNDAKTNRSAIIFNGPEASAPAPTGNSFRGFGKPLSVSGGLPPTPQH